MTVIWSVAPMVACWGVVVAPYPALSPLETEKLWLNGCDPSDWNHAMPSRTRSTGFVPPAFQGWFPVFVTVIWIVFVSPKYAAASAALVNVAAYLTGATVASRRAGVLPSEPNQATPSRTRSKVSAH